MFTFPGQQLVLLLCQLILLVSSYSLAINSNVNTEDMASPREAVQKSASGRKDSYVAAVQFLGYK